MSNYRATGAGDFEMYVGCRRLREIQTEMSELTIQYIIKKGRVDVPEPAQIAFGWVSLK